jgi:hypothetical protein
VSKIPIFVQLRHSPGGDYSGRAPPLVRLSLVKEAEELKHTRKALQTKGPTEGSRQGLRSLITMPHQYRWPKEAYHKIFLKKYYG